MRIYRLLSAILLAAYAPWAVLRSVTGRRRLGDLRGRLGRVPYPDVAGGVWIHAVSVGEVAVARSVLGALARRLPDVSFALSTTTEAGRQLAASTAPPGVPVFAFPLDLAGPVERSLEGVRPGLVLLTETEIWPLFLERAERRGIPVALVNGRISTRSFRRYRLLRRAFAGVLGRVAVFAMQTDADARRLADLGAPPERIRVTGNAKFDLPEAPEFSDASRLRAAAAARPVVVAGSTAPEEEEAVLDAWSALSPRPLLVLAPRRPERFAEVAALLQRRGLPYLRRSSPSPAITDHRSQITDCSVYLLDSIGELASVYREAALAFVGGSLTARGGHNPIEAWAAGVPVVVGPHTENFRQVVAEGERLAVISRVTGAADLARELSRALSDATATAAAGERARRLVAENRGAAERTADAVVSLLSPEKRKRIAR